MNAETTTHSRRRRLHKECARLLLWLFGLLAAPSCQDFLAPEGIPSFSPSDRRSSVQEGELTLRDGEEMFFGYQKPFQAPPRLVIVELLQSRFEAKPYHKSDFQFVCQEATYFKIRNLHAEQGSGCWATVKWRAEGILASGAPVKTGTAPTPPAQDSKTAQAQLIARIKKAGGNVVVNPPAVGPVVVIDLHRTAVTDADLAPLQGLPHLCTLNLYGTKITDAGLKYISGLTTLQTLYLNNTPVTDAGLPHLQKLVNLRELGLHQTHVTDVGLASLKSLTSLSELSLSGVQISDQGLMQLKGLFNLRHLFLTGTSVTPAGVYDLKRALPKLQVIQ
jgi:hypothetical protein